MNWPIIGYILLALGGCLVVWYFARPKAKRPFDSKALRSEDWDGNFTIKAEDYLPPFRKRDKHGRFVK